jgi:hypothetical protein
MIIDVFAVIDRVMFDRSGRRANFRKGHILAGT